MQKQNLRILHDIFSVAARMEIYLEYMRTALEQKDLKKVFQTLSKMEHEPDNLRKIKEIFPVEE